MRTKNLKEITSGLQREVIEYLEANTELSRLAIDSHKKDFKHNFLYILIGFIFSISGTIAVELLKGSDTQSIDKQLHEINVYEKNQSIEFRQMRLEIESLKSELDSLKRN
jgi:hypothetical protein